MLPRSLQPTLRALFIGASFALAAACAEEQPTSAISHKPADKPESERIDSPGDESATAGQDSAAAPSSTELSRRMQSVDPALDGWTTEVANERVGVQLKVLKGLLEEPEHPEASAIADLLSTRFACTPLRPLVLEDGYTDGSTSVRRADVSASELSYRGADGLAATLAELRGPYAPGAAADLHVKFKVTGVEAAGDTASTLVLVQLSGQGPEGVLQQNAEWTCVWELPADGTHPLLASIRVARHEEVLAAAGPLFGDCTEAVLGGDDSFDAHIRVSLETWLGTIQKRLFDGFYGHQGIAIADVNGDNRDDVYLCQPGGLPNRLYLQQPDGTARDAAAEAGIDFLDPTGGVLFLDFDEDGDQDLLLAMDLAIVFLENDGAGKFESRWYRAYSQIRSISAADYDQDGDLDVFCCCYKVPDENGVAPLPYHDANNGEPNILLRNDGNWEFTEVTREVGLDTNNRRFSFASSWEDYDEDGDLDLYVSNDFGRNNLYRNDDGHFVDVAPEAGVEDISAGMSVTWGDYDNDGLMDIYVSNMFSSAGNRVAYQRSFMEDEDEGTRSLFQRHARGNSLFRNAGDGTFKDVSIAAGVTMGRWSWGSKFVDLNNDGLEDLVATNGFITNEQPQDL